MTYEELDAKLQGRCREQRKLGNNTWAVRSDNTIFIKFHATYILAFRPNGNVELNAGHWFTVTTKQRLNQYLPSPFGVYSFKSQWMVTNGSLEPYAVFSNWMIIHPDGSIEGAEYYDEYRDRLKRELAEHRRNLVFHRLRCWEFIDGHYCNLFLRPDRSCARHGILTLPGEDYA